MSRFGSGIFFFFYTAVSRFGSGIFVFVFFFFVVVTNLHINLCIN